MLKIKPRILNVDDFDDGRFVKSEILRMAGFQVLEAATGKEALKQVASQKPDLVLLDVKLPDINGFEVCRRIKKLRGFAPMVLQISMAYNLVENQTAGLESGADAYLVGPVEPDLLVANVKALLRMQRAEQEVRDAGREWQSTFDAILDGVALVSLDGIVIRHNRSFLEFVNTEYVGESYVGRNIAAALGDVTLDPTSFPHVRAKRTAQKESVELPVGERWIRMIAEPIIAEDGSMQKLVVSLRDFTARKSAEIERSQLLLKEQRAKQKAEESEHNLRITTESMPQIVWVADASGAIEYVNHQWYEYTGQPMDGQAEAVLHEDDRDRVRKTWAASLRTGEVFEYEFRLKRAIDNVYFWHLARAVPIRDQQGSVYRWIGTITNIDDKRRAEEQNKFLAEASQVLLNCLDVDAIIKRVGEFIVPTYADWLSLDLVDDTGESRRVLSVHHDPTKAKLLKRVYDEFPSPKTAQYGYPRVLKTGRSQLVSPLTPSSVESAATCEAHREILIESGMRSMMCVPLITRDRVIGCLTAAITEKRRIFDQRDLLLIEDLALRIATTLDNAQLLADTQREVVLRREAEARAKEAVRLAEHARLITEEISEGRERLLAVVTHEWRSPLSAINNAVALLEDNVAEDALVQPVKIIKRNLESQSALLEDLTDFVRARNRKLRFEPKECDVHQVLQEVADDLRQEIAANNLDLTIALNAEGSIVMGDKQRLAQVFRNILRNALKFTPAGGSISVTTGERTGRLLLHFEDNGQGISPEFLPKVFTSFEQGTDSRSKDRAGMGLGLAISQSIVEMHGGRITADSAGIGKGSSFTVELPLL